MTDEVRTARLGPLPWLVILVWPVIVAGAALKAYGVLALDERLADRPKVVVLDVQDAVQQELRARGGDNAALSAATEHVREYARSLRTAGYLVLDTSYVYAFPADAQTTPAVGGAGAARAEGEGK